MKKVVSAQFLLEGTYYALEQCGVLLRSASILYDERQLASSVVLTAFGREELGRSRILLNFLVDVLIKGKTVSLDRIQNACKDHVRKQEWALVTRVTRGRKNDKITRLIRTMHTAGDQEWQFNEAWKEIKQIAAQQAKRRPTDRHKKRIKALYVEPSENGLSWNRPSEQVKDDDENDFFLLDAINDYSITIAELTQKDGPVGDLIQQWTNRPQPPPPSWPKRPQGA